MKSNIGRRPLTLRKRPPFVDRNLASTVVTPIAILTLVCFLYALPNLLRNQQSLRAPSATTQAPSNVGIWIDSTKTISKSLDASQLFPVIKADTLPPWDGWTRLNGAPLEVNSSNTVLTTYGCKTDFGFNIIVTNQGPYRTPFKLTARMTSGTYLLEKLSIGTNSTNSPNNPERLESIVVGGTQDVIRPQFVEAKSALILKFVNQSNLCQKDLSDLLGEIKALYASRPREARLLGSPLNDTISQVDAICNDPSHRVKSRARVQRALLSLSQVEALAENLLRQSQISETSAKAIRAAMVDAQSHLMSLSFVCYNVVPFISFEADMPQPVEEAIHVKSTKVHISLNNLGDQTIVNVKLGITTPSGTLVLPKEAAVFTELSPGQKASADFDIQSDNPIAWKEIRVQFSYFAQRTPVHIDLPVVRK